MHKVNPNQTAINNALTKLRDVMLYDTTVQQLQKPTPMPPTKPMQHQPTQKPTQMQHQPPKPTQMQHQLPKPTQMQPIQSNENVFRPALNQDPLFWCLYVMMNGTFKYEQLANRFTAEQDGKRDQIMMLRDKGKALKQTTGLKFAASTIEGDIMSQRISLHAFQVLVHLNSRNAVFVNPANRVYAEFISDAVSDKPVHVIERTNKQITMTQATETQLAAIRATNYRIENLQKPIKSASAYTVAELTEMCHQLKIQLKSKMKKQELYDAITKQLVL
jgi:hypothetical protein